MAKSFSYIAISFSYTAKTYIYRIHTAIKCFTTSMKTVLMLFLIVYLSISSHQKPTCLYLTYITEIKLQ